MLIFCSCNKKEFSRIRPDKKLIEINTKYTELLTESENGWIGYLYPTGGKAYTFRFVFNKENRVFTSGTLDERYTANEMESSYRIVADQIPTLSFDTYSYLHLLSDPDEYVYGGIRGRGHISDFEFSFIRSSMDTIQLKGNHNGSKLVLIRANSTQDKSFIKKTYEINNIVKQINDFPLYHKKIIINNKEFTFSITPHINAMCFYYMEGNEFKQKTTLFSPNNNGIRFKDSINLAGISFQELSDFKINPLQNAGSFKINNQLEVKIEGIEAPLFIDKNAGNRFRQSSKQFYSPTMFTINGHHEALMLRDLDGFIGGYYISNITTSGLDALYLVYRTGLRYVGPLFYSHIDDQGVLKFNKYQEASGIIPSPAELVILRRFNDVWFNSDGYYVFQSGPDDFDLVNSKNAKIWVRFN